MSSRTRRDYRGVFRPVGAAVMGLALTLLLCGGVGFALERHSGSMAGTWSLVAAAVISVIVGGVMWLYGSRHRSEVVTRREATLAVALIWVVVGF